MTDDRHEKRAEELKRTAGIGPTGRFPEGKLNDADRGELKAALGVEGDKLVLHFGTPVPWVAMTRAEALALAGALVGKALTMPAD